MAFPADYGKRCELILAQVGENMTDFTVSLNENGLPAEIFSIASDGGGELRFSSDVDGTNQIPRDVRAFSTAGGTADIAVKVPSLSNTAPTSIWVWYDSSDLDHPPGDPNGQYATYDSFFESVWPLSEDPTGGPGSILDRTSNAAHLTPTNMQAGDLIDGQLGKAIDFRGAGNYLSRTFSPSLTLPTATISTCFNPSVGGANNDRIVDCLWNAGGYMSCFGSSNYGGAFRGSIAPFGAISAATEGVWNHMGVIYDGAVNQLVMNGASTDTYNATGSVSIGAFALGENRTNTPGSNRYTGAVDEVRLSSTARSVAWIIAEYQNLFNMATFVTVGVPELPGGDIITTVTATNAAGVAIESFRWAEVPPP